VPGLVAFYDIRPGDGVGLFEESFGNYMHMDFCAFEHLLSMIENDVLKKHTVMRQSLSPREKLSITMRFLARGL